MEFDETLEKFGAWMIDKREIFKILKFICSVIGVKVAW